MGRSIGLMLAILGGLALFMAQTAVWDRLAIVGAKPDFALMMVIFLATNCPFFPGAVVAFLFGYLMDTFSSLPLGVSTAGLLVVHYLANLSVHSLFLDTLVFQGGLVFAGVLGHGLMVFLLLNFVGYSAGPFLAFMSFQVYKAAYTAALTPLVFSLFKKALPGTGLASEEPPLPGLKASTG